MSEDEMDYQPQYAAEMTEQDRRDKEARLLEKIEWDEFYNLECKPRKCQRHVDLYVQNIQQEKKITQHQARMAVMAKFKLKWQIEEQEPEPEEKPPEPPKPPDPAMFEDRQSSEAEDIRWVTAMSGFDINDIDLNKCPSAAAYSMLTAVQADQLSKKDMFALWAKLLPSGAQLEHQRKVRHAEMSLHGLLDDIEEYGDDRPLQQDPIEMPKPQD